MENKNLVFNKKCISNENIKAEQKTGHKAFL